MSPPNRPPSAAQPLALEGLVLSSLPSDLRAHLDDSRPHVLLTRDPDLSPSLQYRYLDTNETVTVPNVPKNQSFATRADALLWYAKRCEERAAEVLTLRAAAGLGAASQANSASAEELLAAANEMRFWAAVLEKLASPPPPSTGAGGDGGDEFTPPTRGH